MNKPKCSSNFGFGKLNLVSGGVKSEEIEILVNRLKKLSHFWNFCKFDENWISLGAPIVKVCVYLQFGMYSKWQLDFFT